MGQSEMPDCQSRKSFEQYKERLHISKACSKRISEEFQRQIDEGLQTNEGSQQPWESGPRIIPTMITQMPTGNEAGEYFGIHVSGSHINIVYTELSELPHAVKIVQTYSTPITEHLRNCGAEELFEHIAEEALMFSASISRNLVSRTNNILCGLAFSFPCTHASLQQGTLLKWSKGFNIDGVCGNDPALMLNCALKQRVSVLFGNLLLTPILLSGTRAQGIPKKSSLPNGRTSRSFSFVHCAVPSDHWELA